MAPVVDIEQARVRRARRGAQIGRGQIRRADPAVRAPRIMMRVDWEAMAELSRHEIVQIERGQRRPPQTPAKMRRSGRPVRNVKGVLSRPARRLGWKVERKLTRRLTGQKVAWSESQAAMGALAPVIPMRRRGVLARIRASLPQGGRARVGDPMGDVA